MNIKIIAICTDTEIFNQNRMFDYEFAKKYFGLLAMYYVHQLLPEYNVVTGDVALKLISDKRVDAQDVMIIQEQDAKIGEALIKLGAFAHTIFCLESQIYAKKFYSKLSSLPQIFKNRVFFDGLFEYTSGCKNECHKENNFHSYFPSYENSEILKPKNWERRDFVSLVMGNKFYSYGNIFPRKIRFKKIIKWAWGKYIYKDALDKYLQENELQNKRLEFVEFFGSRNILNQRQFKLYGNGWDSLDNLPKTWENRLTEIIKNLNPKSVEDKLEAISNCKFNLCIENLRYKGYITEKLIHSFVAGAIPVYLGAPDIEKYIPKNCFIDVRDFETTEELFDYMNNLSAEKAQEYIANGQEFLYSKEGQKYSFRGFAQLLTSLVKEENCKECMMI